MRSRAREGAKTMSLAFVLLDFQHAGGRSVAVRRPFVVVMAALFGTRAAQQDVFSTLIFCPFVFIGHVFIM